MAEIITREEIAMWRGHLLGLLPHQTFAMPQATLDIILDAAEASLSHPAALEAECARKDEALRQIADPRNWEEQDRARSIARAALGPWRPTHQSRERDHIKVREVGRGYGPDRLMQMVLYEGPPPGNSHVLYADIFGDHYRPLTPAEQAAYVEAAREDRP